MRNDARDELDDMPSLKADLDDLDEFDGTHGEPLKRASARAPTPSPQTAPPVPRGAGNGALWALVGALVIALASLGWWNHQQVSLMGRQLVATQESFARISEEADGRLQDISGKVVATESSVTSESEGLKLRVKQLESKVAELTRQQQSETTRQSGQDTRIERLAADLKTQQGTTSQLDGQLKTLAAGQAGLKTAQADLAKLETQLKSLSGDVAGLKKVADPSPAIKRLEQDLLVLRSELENRPAQSSSTAEFDSYRAQVTRNISTLQSQVQNLQQQLDAR